MKSKCILTVVFFCASALVFLGAGCGRTQVQSQPEALANLKQNMKADSPAFNDMEKIPRRFTCDGENINPLLNIYNVPSTAKSLALIVDDPDAPGKIWSHWVMWNMPPNLDKLPENSFPDGAIMGTNDFGNLRYDGPCPPGTDSHRYEFKIYALDTILVLPGTTSKEDLEKAINGHVVDFFSLTGIYNRE